MNPELHHLCLVLTIFLFKKNPECTSGAHDFFSCLYWEKARHRYMYANPPLTIIKFVPRFAVIPLYLSSSNINISRMTILWCQFCINYRSNIFGRIYIKYGYIHQMAYTNWFSQYLNMRDPRKESKSGRRNKIIESCTEFIHTMLYYKQIFLMFIGVKCTLKQK